MLSAQRPSPGIFKGNSGFGGNIKVLKSAFFFQYSRPFGYYKSVISKRGEITQNVSMFCKYVVADKTGETCSALELPTLVSISVCCRARFLG